MIIYSHYVKIKFESHLVMSFYLFKIFALVVLYKIIQMFTLNPIQINKQTLDNAHKYFKAF